VIIQWSRNGDEDEWRNGASFSFNNLEALLNVAFESKEWMAAHTLKR